MKKRIGTIYNKPIIEGDINLKTPNEIHKSELKGGGDNPSGGSVSKYAPRYFKIDWDKASEDWYKMLTDYESNGHSNYNQMFAASYKVYNEGSMLILPIIFVIIGISSEMIVAFSYIPLLGWIYAFSDYKPGRLFYDIQM